MDSKSLTIKLNPEISKLKTSLEAIIYSRVVSKQNTISDKERLLINYSLESLSEQLSIGVTNHQELGTSSIEKLKEFLCIHLARAYSNKNKLFIDKVALSDKDKNKLLDANNINSLNYYRPNESYVNLLNEDGFDIDKIFKDLNDLHLFYNQINDVFNCLIQYLYNCTIYKNNIDTKIGLEKFNGLHFNEPKFTGLINLNTNHLEINDCSSDICKQKLSSFNFNTIDNTLNSSIRKEIYTISRMSISEWIEFFKNNKQDERLSFKIIDKENIIKLYDNVSLFVSKLNTSNISYDGKEFMQTVSYVLGLRQLDSQDIRILDLLVESLVFHNKFENCIFQIFQTIINALYDYLNIQLNAYLDSNNLK